MVIRSISSWTGSTMDASRAPCFSTPMPESPGLPATAVPAGLSSRGLPLSIQILGAPWRDKETLVAASAFQVLMGEVKPDLQWVTKVDEIDQ